MADGSEKKRLEVRVCSTFFSSCCFFWLLYFPGKPLSAYKELRAWKLAIELTDMAYHLCKVLPPEEKYALLLQILRASISVPSNIAEGMGRCTKRDTIHFLHIARGSLYELQTLIELTHMQRYIEVNDKIRFDKELMEALKTLNELIRYFSTGLFR